MVHCVYSKPEVNQRIQRSNQCRSLVDTSTNSQTGTMEAKAPWNDSTALLYLDMSTNRGCQNLEGVHVFQ